MLIECPACHARAKLPDSKEGAKVRCGECGRVYLALPAGSGRGSRSSSGQNTGLIVGIGAAVVGLIVILLIKNVTGGGSTEPVAKETEPDIEEPMADLTGYNSVLCQAAVSVHKAAYDEATDRLLLLLDAPRIWAREQAAATADGQAPPAHDEFALLAGPEREEHLFRYAEDLIKGESKALVADWEPFDGEVIEEDDTSATVHLQVYARAEGDVTKRWVEWKVVKTKGRWKVWSWERWISPAEQKDLLRAKRRNKGYEKVTLSDGSKVLERVPEPLPHLDDTPPELRAEIDQLYATMIDLELTKESTRARARLQEIGRPAIPILLTGLYEIPLDTEPQSIQVNMIAVALRKITGQYFGYKPQELVGSGTGTSAERRESAIRQWFAWWHRNEKKFIEKEVVDGLEGKFKLTEREKALIERDG